MYTVDGVLGYTRTSDKEGEFGFFFFFLPPPFSE